jgi:hypothetical protein
MIDHVAADVVTELDARKFRTVSRVRDRLRALFAGSDAHVLQQAPSSHVLVELRVAESARFPSVWHVLAHLAEHVEFEIDRESIAAWVYSGICYHKPRILVHGSNFWTAEDDREYQLRRQALLDDICGDHRGFVYFILAVLPGADRERQLHKRFAVHRVRGEWFRQDPEILTFIDSLKQSIDPPPALPRADADNSTRGGGHCNVREA